MVYNYNLRTETVETEGSLELSGLLVLLNCQALNSGRGSVSKGGERWGNVRVLKPPHPHTPAYREPYNTYRLPWNHVFKAKYECGMF